MSRNNRRPQIDLKSTPAATAGPGQARAAGRAAGAHLLIPFGHWRTVVLLALTSAGLMALAFPPLSWSWAAHLALAPMLLAIVRAPSRWSIVLGTGLAGAVFFGGEMYWLVMSTWPSYVGVVLFCLLFWIGFGLLLRWTARKTKLPLALLAPIWWVSMEIARSYALTGFPWLLLGHAQARTLVLLQSADLAGVYGLSALSAATAGLLVDLVTRPIFLRYGGHIHFSRSLNYAAAGVFVFWVATLSYGIYRLRPVKMSEGPQVITVQSSVPQEIMPTFVDDESKGGLLRAYNQLHGHTIEALEAHPQADLIVWPETMSPGYMNWEVLQPHVRNELLPSNIRRWRHYWMEIHNLIADSGASLLVGSQAAVWHDGRSRTPDHHNSAILFRPDDAPYFSRTRYDKTHLVPFGEYVPFRESFPWLYNVLMNLTPYDEEYNLTPGDNLLRMSVGDSRFAVPICFESSIARVCRRMVYSDGRKKSDFLANISNDGWFHGTIELEQHWDQSVFRAVENRVPVVRSVNTGISGFIDSSGRTVRRVEDAGLVRSVTGYAHWQLSLDPRTSFYGLYGDVFGFLLCGFGLLLAGVSVAAGRRKRSSET